MLKELSFFKNYRSQNQASLSPKSNIIYFSGTEINKYVFGDSQRIGIAEDKEGNLIIIDSGSYNHYTLRQAKNKQIRITCKLVVESFDIKETTSVDYEVLSYKSEVEDSTEIFYIKLYTSHLKKSKGD